MEFIGFLKTVGNWFMFDGKNNYAVTPKNRVNTEDKHASIYSLYKENCFFSRIQLNETIPQWYHPDQVNQLSLEALYNDFRTLKTCHYSTPIDIYMKILWHERKSLLLIIFDHPIKGIDFELGTFYADGDVTYITTNALLKIPMPSNYQHWIKPRYTLAKAMDFLIVNRKLEPMLSINEKNVIDHIENVYAEVIDHIIHMNCIVPDNEQQEHDTPIIKPYPQLKINECDRMISEICLDGFLKNSTLSNREWDYYRESILVVHDNQSVDEIWDNYFSHLNFLSSHKDLLHETRHNYVSTPLKYFNFLNKQLPETNRYRKIYGMVYPVQANIFFLYTAA